MFLLVAYVLMTWGAPTRAEPLDGGAAVLEQRIGSGNPVAGKRKAQAENCLECHGENGVSTTLAVPKLAGQYADYLLRQISDFQTGARKHPIMNAMAEGLAANDVADIAAYFAGNETMRGERRGESQPAVDIYTRGDMARNIPPCKSCHGETGKGKFAPTGCYPVIGGQHRNYLREQLFNWRAGVRSNSPGGVMNVIAASLSDAEIEQLSDYLSGL
ncbi:MAG TPA: c-type cytochrome [Gallionella sp.]|nr:c-type cytochrome [Gallionella sp.]